jgi:arginyl-tRNA synthetase
VTESRLKLVAATKQVLANILGLIGVSAPDKMERLEGDEEEAAG